MIKNKNVSRLSRVRSKKRDRRNTFCIISCVFIAFVIGYTLGFGLAKRGESIELLSPIEELPKFKAEAATVNTQDVIQNTAKIAKVTAYSCGGLETDAEILMNCPSLFSGNPKTADGTTPVPYKTVACDRANLGRYFEIESVGRVKCTDTGGAINGASRFDLYVSTVDEAWQWGVKKLKYTEVK